MAAATALLLVATASSASADNWGFQDGPNTSISFQDDSLISYQFDTNLSSRMRSATYATLAGSYATTDLNILRVGDGHGADWNNHYAIGTMPDPKWIGYHDCITPVGVVRCRHGHIRYRYASLSTTTYEQALACHETGHSVALRHTGWTANKQSIVRCMWDPVPNDPFVGPHNAAHINAQY